MPDISPFVCQNTLIAALTVTWTLTHVYSHTRRQHFSEIKGFLQIRMYWAVLAGGHLVLCTSFSVNCSFTGFPEENNHRNTICVLYIYKYIYIYIKQTWWVSALYNRIGEIINRSLSQCNDMWSKAWVHLLECLQSNMFYNVESIFCTCC